MLTHIVTRQAGTQKELILTHGNINTCPLGIVALLLIGHRAMTRDALIDIREVGALA